MLTCTTYNMYYKDFKKLSSFYPVMSEIPKLIVKYLLSTILVFG